MVLDDLSSSEAILARLVGFDTTSRNSNLALIAYVRSLLDRHGVAYRVSESPDGGKANLHAIIGPQASGGIALSGHVDTVPVDGQAWHGDPFVLRQDGERLYGRGTADMKGFVACMLAAVPALAARGLAKPLHLFITYDEETTMDGARRLVADLAASGLRPNLCVVGEPTCMQPIVAHKGRLALAVRVRGLSGHSSMPQRGVNAVQAAARAITWIADRAAHHAGHGPFEEGFDPPYTTLHVGTVQGGSILNIIPEQAEFVMECRTVPGVDAEEEFARLRQYIQTAIEPAMRQVDPATGFSFARIGYVPALSLPQDHPLADMVRALTGANSAGKVSYATEASIYQREAEIPTIVCGPGDIAQAHKQDEYVTRAQLAACDSFIDRLAERWLV